MIDEILNAKDEDVYAVMEKISHRNSCYDILLDACKKTIGFCVNFRQTEDWENHPDIGVLYAIVKQAVDKAEKLNVINPQI